MRLCSSCSRITPAFPLAGLMIGNGSATCGFYSHHNPDDGLEVTMTTNKMDYSQGGHKLLIEWSSKFGRAEDEYGFAITLDGLRSYKSAKYSGTPITLLDTPLKVSVENINQEQ